MSTFHRNMLNKMESKHDQLVAAAEAKVEPIEADDTAAIDAEKAAAEKAQALREKGAAIDVNEEGYVVDKTQLLSGGLNMTATKKRAADDRSAESRKPQQAYQGRNKTQQDMRARQVRNHQQRAQR